MYKSLRAITTILLGVLLIVWLFYITLNDIFVENPVFRKNRALSAASEFVNENQIFSVGTNCDIGTIDNEGFVVCAIEYLDGTVVWLRCPTRSRLIWNQSCKNYYFHKVPSL